MRKDFYVKRSVAGQKTSVCSRAGSRSCVSSVELKPEARTRLRRAPALIRGGHDFCAQRPRRGLVTGGADSGSIYWPACEEIGGAHSPSAGRFLRTCTVSTEEPGMAGLLAREATCGAPPTASAELGLPGV